MSTSESEQLREYQFIKRIGKGSFGEVYLVRKRRDRKQCVMKNIRLSTSSIKERYAATQEAELLSQLRHPNIVSYHKSFQDEEGILHIVMGYCEGGDLCTRLKSLKGNLLEENKVVEWFVQIALALQYLHDKKIMHRDLKTQNIFLSKHDVVKVGDLGIARVLEGSLDLAHTVVGTPYYMSPELFANKPYDYKSDVWALGCCVYEMATLNHAFSAKNISALMYKILQGRVPPLPLCFSRELNGLVCEMLSLEASERPSVHQILRTDFVRSHIKQFLDRASVKRKKDSRPADNPPCDEAIKSSQSEQSLSSNEQKVRRPLPPAPAPGPNSSLEHLKPLQMNAQLKPSPELSLAREKRRRSKQEARGRVILRSRSGSGSKHEGNTGDSPSPSGVVTHPSEDHDGERSEEENEVLSIMDNTLHLPERPKPTQQTENGLQLLRGVDQQMAAIKSDCIAAFGAEVVSKALLMLDDEDSDELLQDKMAALLGPEKCGDFLPRLQKIKLYEKK